jgi:membrane protein YdbS with pleckstrin-like domain
MTSLFMQSLNDVISLHEKRVIAAVHNRVPGAIWIGLYLLLVIAMAVMGYYEGTSGMIRSLAVFGMVVAFSSVFALIVDLDRPGQGLLEVSQQAMLDVQRSMRAMP